MQITIRIDEQEIEGDYGYQPGIIATCSECGLEIEVFGQEDASKKRACAKMREQCRRGEDNYYTYRD